MAVDQFSVRKKMLERLREDVYSNVYTQPRKKTLPPLIKSLRKPRRRVFSLVPDVIISDNPKIDEFERDSEYNLSLIRTISTSSTSSTTSNVTQLRNFEKLEFQRLSLNTKKFLLSKFDFA